MPPLRFNSSWQRESHVEKHPQEFNIFSGFICVANSVVGRCVSVQAQLVCPITDRLSNRGIVPQKFNAFEKRVAFFCTQLFGYYVENSAAYSRDYRWRYALVQHVLRVHELARNFLWPMRVCIRSRRCGMDFLNSYRFGPAKYRAVARGYNIFDAFKGSTSRFEYDQRRPTASGAVAKRGSVHEVVVRKYLHTEMPTRRTLSIKFAQSFNFFWRSLCVIEQRSEVKIDQLVAAAAGTWNRKHSRPQKDKK